MLALIAGCGALGGRVAARLAGAGHEVHAVSRSGAAVPPGVRHVAADLVAGRGLDALAGAYDLVLWSAAPAARDEEAYRAIYLDAPARLLARAGCARLGLVTSTAVFGQDHGELVDEDSEAAPSSFNGRVLVEAEARARGLADEVVVLRPSGLYGPGRRWLVDRARAGRAPSRRWTNRIHLDDAAGACVTLLGLAAPAPCYLLSDDRPAREDEVLGWMRERMGLPPLPPPEGAECGKRVANARMRAAGVALACPDYRAGYAALSPADAGASGDGALL